MGKKATRKRTPQTNRSRAVTIVMVTLAVVAVIATFILVHALDRPQLSPADRARLQENMEKAADNR